jgi:hypothetical protein
MLGEMRRKGTISTPKQQMPPVLPPPVAVNRDDDLDVLEKIRKRAGVCRDEVSGGDMVSMGWCLDDSIEGGSCAFSNLVGDGVGRALEIATVVRHDSEATAQLAEFGDLGARQKFSQHFYMILSPELYHLVTEIRF